MQDEKLLFCKNLLAEELRDILNFQNKAQQTKIINKQRQKPRECKRL